MATLDKVNVFAPKDPKTGKTYQLFNTEAIQQKQEESKKNYELIRNQIAEGNIEQAYEGFTQLPFIEQMAVYMTPGLGNVVDAYEAQYFGKLATKENVEQGMRTQQEMELESLATGLPPTPFRGSPEQSLYSGLSGLAGVSSLIGVGELPSLLKGAVLFGGRKLGAIPSATDMGAPTIQAADATGGGGGIGGLPTPKQETTKDLAGTYSKTLEEAKAVSGEMSPQALLQYMKSNKRTNPSNNKTGTALTQSEIDEIDFSAFEEQYPNKNYTNEDILQYIDDNRIQLYRVSRAEDNPTYGTGPKDGIEFNLDGPLTSEIKFERQNAYYDDYYSYILEQKDFFDKNFGPEGIINKDSYDAFVQRQRDFIQRRDVDTSGQAPSQLTKKYITETYEGENPFAAAVESQFDVFDANGNPVKLEQDFDTLNMLTDGDFDKFLDEGYTFRPKVMEPTYDVDRISEKGAIAKINDDYEQGFGEEAYRYITDDDDLYEIIGSDNGGYFVKFNGEFDDRFSEGMSLDEARIQISQQEGIGSGIGRVDDYQSEDNLIDVLPEDVIEGNATIPTKYGEQYDSFRLPMGGATNYQEHTIHVKNPKTATRYSYGSGTKHFGGGDELFHYRTTVRTDENGKKVLFVEEIQSDLHSTARSTEDAATYETTPKQKQEISENMQKIDPRIEFGQLNKDFPDSDDYVRFGFDEDAMLIPVSQVRRLAADDIYDQFVTPSVTSKQLDYILKNISPEQLKDVAKQLDSYTFGKLPNFPYKGNAWVDAVTKDAMKLGAELDVDRVAFTNAAKQIDRNNKSLNYVQDKVITEVPTEKEILDSVEFANDVLYAEKIAYDNFVSDPNSLVSNFKRVTGQDSRFLDMPVPTKKEFYADMPNKRKRMKVLETQEKNITNEMYQKLDDDLTRFMQEYPEVSKEFIEEELDGTARGVLNAYKKMSEAELTELGRRANVDLDLISDPKNIDVTNPALARLLDADLNFREIPQFQTDKLGEIRYVTDEKNYLNQFLEFDPLKIREGVLEELTEKYGTGSYKYNVQDVGYRLDDDEILNPQRIQMEGDDYDTQRINNTRLTNDEELLAEIPEKFKEQVKKDLAAGKKEITLNIDDLEGSGKKFLEIYKNGIIRGINKSVKDLKVDAKPDVSNVLFSTDTEYLPDEIFNLFKNDGAARSGVQQHSAIGIDLTTEMKQKLLTDGYASMYMGGKVTKSNSMDRPIEGNRREM